MVAIETISEIYTKPLNDLVFEAQAVHRQYQVRNHIQLATLTSIKTGACPEDCGYCSQSGHYQTHVEKEKMVDVEAVLIKAREAKANGSTRFCMGAAFRSPPAKVMPQLLAMIKGVKALGLETCMTLGMLDAEQAMALKAGGLDFYNHNIDTSPNHYQKIVSTRTFQDRLNTITAVREAGIKVCCGGILGLGETRQDRIEFLHVLSNLSEPPESVPINCLIPVAGTPLSEASPVDPIELIRTIATARILMPKSVIRLTAGRQAMSEELQAFCFFAGANSIFSGSRLFTEANPELSKDEALLCKLGMNQRDTCSTIA